MSVFRMNLNLWPRFVMFVMVLLAGGAVGKAQTPPYTLFQNSTLTGAGNTVTATWLPVITASGTSYVNLSIQFDVAPDGTLTVTPGYPQVVPAPPILISKFRAGTYAGPSNIYNGDFLVTVTGPGATVGGATEWSLAAASGASSCTYPSDAWWYVFNGAMSQHPLATRLQAAGISQQTYKAYMWGYSGDYSCNTVYWPTNTLLGLSQMGKTLSITSFTHSGQDQASPVDMIPYILQ